MAVQGELGPVGPEIRLLGIGPAGPAQKVGIRPADLVRGTLRVVERVHPVQVLVAGLALLLRQDLLIGEDGLGVEPLALLRLGLLQGLGHLGSLADLSAQSGPPACHHQQRQDDSHREPCLIHNTFSLRFVDPRGSDVNT